jgi:hypothetical protein
MTGLELWNVPDRNSSPKGQDPSLYGENTYIQDAFLGVTVRRGLEVPEFQTKKLTKHFTAHACRKCGAITIAGTTYGLRVDLEPQVLNDQTEYAALIAGVPTYDLWPDRTARRRHLEEIQQPERVPRHARHTCGTTYGTLPRPTPPATSQADPTGPAPF